MKVSEGLTTLAPKMLTFQRLKVYLLRYQGVVLQDPRTPEAEALSGAEACSRGLGARICGSECSGLGLGLRAKGFWGLGFSIGTRIGFRVQG